MFMSIIVSAQGKGFVAKQAEAIAKKAEQVTKKITKQGNKHRLERR